MWKSETINSAFADLKTALQKMTLVLRSASKHRSEQAEILDAIDNEIFYSLLDVVDDRVELPTP